MTISQTARAAGMERQALGDASKRYNAEGLKGLFNRAKPGRPRKLDAALEKELSELLMKGPDPDKDGISAYTLDDLVAIAENRWKVKYHSWSLSVAIKRLG
jgi:transposase